MGRTVLLDRRCTSLGKRGNGKMGFKDRVGQLLFAGVAVLAFAFACSSSKQETRDTAAGGAATQSTGGMAGSDATRPADAGSSGDAGTSAGDGGMSGMAHDVGAAAGSAARDTRDAAKSAGTTVAQGAETAGRAVVDAGTAAVGAVKETASSAAAGARSAFGGDGGTSPSASLSDGQILATLSAASTGEIAAAKLALKQSKNAKVKEFANLMIKDHTGANTKGQALAKKAGIAVEENDTSKQVTQDGEDELGKLRKLKGKPFDQAYVDAQVDDHQKVLQLIDGQLIPAAQNGELKSMLAKVRATVSEHLDHARSLQGNLGGAAR